MTLQSIFRLVCPSLDTCGLNHESVEKHLLAGWLDRGQFGLMGLWPSTWRVNNEAPGKNNDLLSLRVGKGVVPLALGVGTQRSFCQTQGCHDDTVTWSCDPDERSQDWGQHLGKGRGEVSPDHSASRRRRVPSARQEDLPRISCHRAHGHSSRSSPPPPARWTRRQAGTSVGVRQSESHPAGCTGSGTSGQMHHFWWRWLALIIDQGSQRMQKWKKL
jgi:hypothetical protein